MMNRRRFAMNSLVGAMASGLTPIRSAFADAAQDPRTATVIEDLGTGATILHQGEGGMRFSPCSSFKIPIALMGFDAGVLTDPHHPRLDYRPEYAASMALHRKATDPTIWLRDSVVWYSQQTTQRLGFERFSDYVARFDYGNGDVSGNPGKNDGLTQAWLMSSLQISPGEQVNFIRRLLDRRLGLSEKATTMTIASMPVFPSAGGWTVRGKTGSGWLKDASGESRKDRPQGWFVGWAEKGQRRLVFARLEIADRAYDAPGGTRAREAFLKELDRVTE